MENRIKEQPLGLFRSGYSYQALFKDVCAALASG
jgi:hypothetical protein